MITCKSLGSIGRFANQMFQIAGIIGIATKNNHPYCFPKWENTDHKERFGSNEPIDLYNYFVNPLPAYVDIPYQYRWIDWGYHDVSLSDGAYDLCGHFQTDKYFSHCIDTVRYYLRIKDEYPTEKNTCAIHYRAGDYIDDMNAYHPRCTKEYYAKAMSLLPEGTWFRVFSDDKDAAKKLLSKIDGHYKFEVIHGTNYIDDFKLMKACSHFITANSSYSLMAAILSEAEDKIIVCPKKWFGDVAGINFDGMYPQSAIVI